jgi:DNA-binding PucR family transcriptional regulator
MAQPESRHPDQKLVLAAAGSVLLDTLTAYLDANASIEGTSRRLFVHANTVRYRLRRIADVTGLSPTDARDAYTMRVALTLGRLADSSHHASQAMRPL